MGIIIDRQLFENQDIEFTQKLKRKETNVDFTSNPVLTGLTFGKGTLFVHEEFLGFYSEETQTGFKIDYRRVVLHAIAIDPESQRKVLYVQLDTCFETTSLSQDNTSTIEEPQDPYDTFTEVRFLLNDPYNDFLENDSDNEAENIYEDAEDDESENVTEEASNPDQEVREANIAHLERALERGMAETDLPVQETESLPPKSNELNGKQLNSKSC